MDAAITRGKGGARGGPMVAVSTINGGDPSYVATHLYGSLYSFFQVIVLTTRTDGGYSSLLCNGTKTLKTNKLNYLL